MKKIIKLYIFNLSYRVVCLHRISFDLINKQKYFSVILGKLIKTKIAKHYSVELNPINKIGYGLILPHPYNIIVGYGSTIGKNATLYNGVTLGAKNMLKFDKNKILENRYPTIENNVIVFSGAKLIGNIKIGKNSIIGANSVVLSSFNENSVIIGIPAKNLKK
ncbi:MAG: hypothetical protein JEY96_12725 [Bacteroidales bacterium]|nr:hypothetical protein [Bacteroidales bacterium]